MTMDMSYAEMNAAYRRARARLRYRLSLAVLVVAAVVAGLLLWRDLRDDRPHAGVGMLSRASADLPVQWRRSVLVPGARWEVTAAVREDVTEDLGVHKLQAPDDGTFVGLGIEESERPAPDIPDRGGRGADRPDLTFALISDGRRYPLSTERTADESYPRNVPVVLPLHGWLAVAGSADELVLEATWGRRIQRVNLRTGDRVPGDFAALYAQRSTEGSPPTTASCGTPTWSTGWRAGPGVPAACSYRVDRPAWSHTKGWAKPGRQWLALTISTSLPSDPIRRVGSRDVAFYPSGLYNGSARSDTAAESPDRLDGARPVALARVDDYGARDTVVLLFDVPRRSGAHTAVVTQLVDVNQRVRSGGGSYYDGVRQTWTIRIPT